MEKIILFGGGGHCRVVIDAILLGKKYEIIGIIDIAEKIGQKVLDIPIIDDDSKINEYFKKGIKYCFITAGSTGITDLRENLFNLAQGAGFSFPNIIHPSSLVSKFARLGYGNYIAPGVIIAMLQKELKDKNIPTRRIFMPLTEFPSYKRKKAAYKNSYEIYQRGLCLPSSMLNSEEKTYKACKMLKSLL